MLWFEDFFQKRHIHVIVLTPCKQRTYRPLSIGVVISELSSLSDSQRQALEHRFNDGLFFEDIGKQMKITHSNARQIASRAVQALRDMFASKGDYK